LRRSLRAVWRRSLSSRKLAALIRLGRPKFLLYSMLYVALGSAVAVYDGSALSAGRLLHCLGFIWAVHLMTHFCNDYFDLAADRCNAAPTAWTGGSRVLADGLLPPTVAVVAAAVLLLIALILLRGFPLLCQRGIGLLIITLAIFYTAPPLRLNYRGLGEITVALVLTVLTPLLAYLVERPSRPGHLLWIVAPLALLQACRMLCMNLADYDGDRRAGKHTLAVRVGCERAAQLFLYGQVGAYGLTAVALHLGLPRAAGLGLLASLPLGLLVALRVERLPLQHSASKSHCAWLASTHIAVAALLATGGLLAQLSHEQLRRGLRLDGAVVSAAVLWLPLLLYLYQLTRQLHAQLRAERA
jgi:1,4-dihydroxy-2-naphthoate octaprenyltransferase